MTDFKVGVEFVTVGDQAAVAKVEAVNQATQRSGSAHAITAQKAEGHRLALGKLGRALENYTEQATGTNHVIGELANTLGAFAVGEAPMIAVLGGIFAVTKAYDVLTEHTREAKKAQEELIAKIHEAANAGNPDAIAAEARRLQFGQPFDKDGKLVANSRFVKGAFAGSLADVRAQLKDAQDRFFAESNGFAQLAIQKQIIALKAQLAPMEAMMARLQEAAANVSGQPSPNGLPITVTAQGPEGAASAATKAADDAAKAAADAFGLGVKRRAAAMKQAVDDTVAMIVENGDIRKHLLDGMLPTKAEIDEGLREVTEHIRDAIEHDPVLIRANMVKEMGEQMGRMLGDGIAGGMVQAMDAGFQEAFSGSGAVGFIEGFGKAVLGALGGIMEQMGAALISYGIAMELVSAGLSNPFTSGPAAIAAGTILVGLGAALSAAVRGGSGHVSTGGYSAATSGLASIIDRGVINPDSYSGRNASTIPVRSMSNDIYNFFGSNDPGLPRWFDEVQRKRDQRGSLAMGTR